MEKLYTARGLTLPATPWNEYPRPRLVRDRWLCLNGEWELRIQPPGGEPRQERITVPFCPESLLSGVKTPSAPGDVLMYRRSFTVPEDWAGERVLLHFGAVSRAATVFLNGREICRHENGYLPFTAEIGYALRPGENVLAVRSVNDLSPKWPLGKQSARPGGMWYTPCSGIWQSVWLEPVPREYIREIRVHTGADRAEIEAVGVDTGVLTLEGREYPVKNGRARIDLPSPRLWSPEDPYLYRFTLTAGEDRAASYFAVRRLSIERREGIPRLCLNGKPYFFNGLLDQGYWSDGLYTPADPACFAEEITAMKALGFNTLRKHIKLEPERFYYECDRLGMIVFQDMVNSGVYRFLRDTALPTAGLRRRDDRRLNTDGETRKNFLSAMEETVELLRFHPSICLWTIFNEGWGQFCADEAYRRLKELDPTRFVDSASGWFAQKESDVESRHIYFTPLRLGGEDRPQLLSEFGGYVWKVPGHSFDPDRTYGYRIFKTRERFVSALRAAYKKLIPLAKKGLCGAIWTQVSDVEEETNGLVTFDRAVMKVRSEELSDLAAALREQME